LSALSNYAVDVFVQTLEGTAEATIRRRGEKVMRKPKRAVLKLKHLYQFITQSGHQHNVSFRIHVEQRFDGDLERKDHHLLMHVAGLVFPPGLKHLLGIVHHYAAIFSYAPAMKSRLRQSPLAQPEVAFARQEPVTENASKEWEAKIDGFNKRPIVCYQDVFNVLRVIENVDGYMKKTKSSYVAVLAR
jgi:hypothetical protein